MRNEFAIRDPGLSFIAGATGPVHANTNLHGISIGRQISRHAAEPALDHFARRWASKLERIHDRIAHGAEWAVALSATVDVPVSPRSRVGRPGAQILAALDDDPSLDLVVTGSHGRTGLRRALLGSVSEQVVRYARCPVLVARARA